MNPLSYAQTLTHRGCLASVDRSGQSSLAFDPPPRPRPTLPHSGLSRLARECSVEAAKAAAPRRGRLQERYLEYLRMMGSVSDHQASEALGVPLTSICSTRNGLTEQRAWERGEDTVVVAVGKTRGPFGTAVTLWSLR